MRGVILIPFRGNGGGRERLLERVLSQLEELPLEVYVGDSGDEPFSIARTWNDLAARAGSWDRALLWGADQILEDPGSAIDGLWARGDLVFCFEEAMRCRRNETELILNHRVVRFREDPLPPDGIKVVSRRLWEELGGYDPRFIGWGHEDRVFLHSVKILGFEPEWIPGRMLNLWHPRRNQLPDALYYSRQEQNHRMLEEWKQIEDRDELRARIRELRARG